MAHNESKPIPCDIKESCLENKSYNLDILPKENTLEIVPSIEDPTIIQAEISNEMAPDVKAHNESKPITSDIEKSSLENNSYNLNIKTKENPSEIMHSIEDPNTEKVQKEIPNEKVPDVMDVLGLKTPPSTENGRLLDFQSNFVNGENIELSNGKPNCKLCNKTFMSLEDMNIHNFILHEQIQSTCDICDEKFGSGMHTFYNI